VQQQAHLLPATVQGWVCCCQRCSRRHSSSGCCCCVICPCHCMLPSGRRCGGHAATTHPHCLSTAAAAAPEATAWSQHMALGVLIIRIPQSQAAISGCRQQGTGQVWVEAKDADGGAVSPQHSHGREEAVRLWAVRCGAVQSSVAMQDVVRTARCAAPPPCMAGVHACCAPMPPHAACPALMKDTQLLLLLLLMMMMMQQADVRAAHIVFKKERMQRGERTCILHTRTVPSVAPEASRAPSQDSARSLISPPWPIPVASSSPVCMHHTCSLFRVRFRFRQVFL
jgi:hypothetical protein